MSKYQTVAFTSDFPKDMERTNSWTAHAVHVVNAEEGGRIVLQSTIVWLICLVCKLFKRYSMWKKWSTNDKFC